MRAIALEMDTSAGAPRSTPGSPARSATTDQRAGTAPVLVQLAGRRPLRRPGHRPISSIPRAWWLSRPEPGQRRHQRFWDRRNGTTSRCWKACRGHYGFGHRAPFESLPPTVQQAILHGSGEEDIRSVTDGSVPAKARRSRSTPSKASCPNMARRYRDTDSVVVREGLARYRSAPALHCCGGGWPRRRGAATSAGEGAPRRAPSSKSRHAARGARRSTGLRSPGQGRHRRQGGARSATGLVFLNDVGLNYLSLDRSAETLWRRAARRSASAWPARSAPGLTGVMYVLDEPSIGLHQRDNDRLIGTLKHLRDIGNSVVVEHDEDMIRAADHVSTGGPGAVVHGGRVPAQGTALRSRERRIRSPASYRWWRPGSITLPGQRGRPRRNGAGRRGARSAAHRRCARATTSRRDVDIPVGLLDLRDRRRGLRQEHAGQRHAAHRRRAPDPPRARRPAPHDAIEGWSCSTR